MTGIPIEVLFAVIGALISVLYWDLRRGLRMLFMKALKRDVLLAKIATKLNIDWDGE